MKPKTLVIALVALVIAAGTAMLIQGWINAQRADLLAQLNKPEAAKAQGLKVLVAARKLPAGTLLKPIHLEWRAWPSDGQNKNYAVKGKRAKKEFVGAVVRSGISAGEPLTNGRVAKPGERGFMAAVLMPGMRAVSVQINRTTGISGFVFPGDRIDLILTHKYQQGKRGKGGKTVRVSETILTGIRVLAVDQSTNDQTDKPKVAKTATLEVTPKQAEVLAVAAQLGKLSLSLRSLAFDETSGKATNPSEPGKRGRTYTRDYDVSRMINRGGGGGSSGVLVLRGSKSRK